MEFPLIRSAYDLSTGATEWRGSTYLIWGLFFLCVSVAQGAPKPNAPEDVSVMAFESLDRDGNGGLSFAEFRNRSAGIEEGDGNKLNQWREKSKAAFVVLDKDGNGQLTWTECASAEPEQWRHVPGSRPMTDANTERRIQMNERFISKDKDHDGRLSLAEYVLGHHFSTSPQEYFARLDVNQDNYLQGPEFFASPEARPATATQFEFYDTNDDEALQLGELTAQRSDRDSAVIGALFKPADSNGDGALNLEEFSASVVADVRQPSLTNVVDLNRDGNVSLDEFTEGVYGHIAEQRAVLFEKLDLDQSGTLQPNEFPFAERPHIIHGSLERKPHFEREFKELDKDGNGELNDQEFLQRNLPQEQSRQKEIKDWPDFAESWFQFLDTNDSKTIDYDEFRMNRPERFARYDENSDEAVSLEELLVDTPEDRHSFVAKAFQWFDHNGDGTWTLKEFEQSGFAAPNREMQFRGFDRDGDGSLSQSEFLAFNEGRDLEAAVYNWGRLDLNLDDELSLEEYQNTYALSETPENIFKAHDKDGDGSVSEQEYVAAFPKPAAPHRRSEFKYFDRNPADGKLNLEEFQILDVARPAPRVSFAGLDLDGDQQLTREEFLAARIERFRDVASVSFDRFDSDSDQALSLQEYAATSEARPFVPNLVHTFVDSEDDDQVEWSEVANTPPAGNHAESLRHYFDTYDLNGDGVLTLPEFPSHVHVPQKNHSAIVHKFLALDQDGNGWISASEFRDRDAMDLPGAQERVNEWKTQADSILASRDENLDGVLTWREFNPDSRLLSPWITVYGEKLNLPSPEIFVRPIFFYSNDKNEDGFLTREELGSGIHDDSARKEILTTDFLQADLDQDGKISLAEFPLVRLARVNVWGEFQRRDRNKNNALDLEEFSLFMPPRAAALLSKLFERFDEDASQGLEFNEYAATPIGKGMQGHVFNLIDWDKDGAVSPEEFIGEQKEGVVEHLNDLFVFLDTNADNRLDYSEYPAFKQSLPPGSPHLFAERDSNRDGQLSFSEYWDPSLKGSVRQANVTLKQAMADGYKEFQLLDIDQSNSLSLAEFQQSAIRKGGKVGARGAMASGGVPTAFLRPEYQPRKETAEEVLSRADENEDEKLSRAEYGSFFKTRLPEDVDYEFARFDEDGDEVLSLEEFRRSPPAHPPVEIVFDVRDRDGDETLSLEEFVDQRDREPGPRERRIFERFDADKSESLSLAEFKSVSASKPDGKTMLATRDIDGDGKLTLQEYREDTGAPPLPQEEADFRTLDLNDDGFVVLAEFEPFERTNAGLPAAAANLESLPTVSPQTSSGGPSSLWLWIGGICAGVVVAGLVFQVRRSR